MLLPVFDGVKDLIVKMGWAKGVFALFFFLAQAWIYSMYKGRLKDRNEEIRRLIRDNGRLKDYLFKRFEHDEPPRTDADAKGPQPDRETKGAEDNPRACTSISSLYRHSSHR